MKQKGFTLIELLVTIAIIALIIGVSLPNFLGARERSRDVKRKSEMAQLKTALRLYFNDYSKYPAHFSTGKIQGCGTNGISQCPVCTTADFAAGGSDGCDTVYMKKFPSELGTSMLYYQISSGDDFLLKVTLENHSDPDLSASQTRCPGVAPYSCGTGYNYCVCSD